MKRKILSLILVFAMTVSLLTVGTGAVEPTYGDTAGHWAESSIERWSAYGIIQGSNGQFDPNGQLTCAQLATILAKLLKLPAAKDAGFTDNTADAWYYDAINRCAAAGILNGNGDGTVTPEAPITRERAIVMLARALGIEPIRKPDLTKYTDAAQVSAYAQGYVAALIEAGIVGGVTADELAPQDNINRASTVTILDRAISTYANEAGTTVEASSSGITLVAADNVTVTGTADSVLVSQGAQDGTVTLSSGSAGSVTVTAENATVYVTSESKADDVTLTETAVDSKVVVLKGAEVGTVTTAAPGSTVSVSGKVDTVATTATAEKASVEVAKNATVGEIAASGEKTAIAVSGKVENVTVSDTATDTTVKANSGSTISKVDNAAEGTTVSGSGKVENVTTSGDNTTVSTPGTKVEADKGTTGTTAGNKDVAGGSSTTTPSGGTSSGSSGGGYSGPTYYTVAFDSNGGSTVASQAVVSGSKAAQPSTPTQSEKTFLFWSASKDTPAAYDFNTAITGNVTLYAIWVNETAVAVIGTNGYDTLVDAVEAAVSGDTVKLLKNVNLSSTLSVSKDVTLDLNGHNIHGEAVRAINVTKGTLTLAGSGTVSSNVANVASSVIRVGSDETGTAGLVVGKDVTISTATAYGITVFGDTTETVTINGTVTSTAPSNASYDGCAVSTVGTDNTEATIIINDGAVLSAANTNAVYMPSGNLTVNGGTITGLTGIYVKSGSTTITGGTITGNGEEKEYTAYGNGGISTGDALVVDSCGYPNGAPKVSVSGGSFTSIKAKAVASYHSGENDTVTKFISGGTFSTSPATYLAPGYKSTQDDDIYVVSCRFAGGSGTEEDPFLIATAGQFRNILSGTSSAPLYYKLTDNIDTSAIFVTYNYVVYSTVEYIVLDGNGKTISGVNDGYLFNAIQNSTLKNLTVDLAAGESGISLNANYKMIYDHVNVTGESSVSGNNGAYTVYSLASDLTFNNCVANVNMSGTSYNAVFVGYVYTYDDRSVTPKLTFNSCENKGSLVCNYAAMFIGNPNAYDIVCNAVDCVNSGTIQATNTNTVLNYYYAVTSNCYGDFIVNGTVYKDIADGRSSAPTCAEDTAVTTTGRAIQGPLNTGMTLTQNADKTFTITDATIEGKTVDHYTVYVGVYAALKAGGSSRNYVTETISASAENKTTALKNLSFVDTQWVEEHSGAVPGNLAGNVTYTLNDETYYMLVTPETDTLNGKTKAPQMIYVVAYDASNKTLASATLFGNIA